MQDIISTLKNALQQAEAGLEVAVGRLAKNDTERGDFKPSEVLALAIVREALAKPVTCLHQIQEPAATEQAAWHAGLGEGRAQAAPAAVAVPNELIRAAKQALACMDGLQQHLGRAVCQVEADALRAALAATPAASATVVLPEPAIAEVMKLVELHRQEIIKVMDDEGSLVDVQSAQDAIEAKLRALLATATGLPAQPIAYLRAAATLPEYGGLQIWKNDGTAFPVFAAPQAQADARDAQLLAFAVSEIRRDEMTDSELLDAMEQKRIAVVPEYEGPWDAEVYNDEGKPNHRGSGSTPREAIRAAIAAQAAQGGE